MTISDRIYGKHQITDQVLVKLIESAPLLRLKRINQAGPSRYLYSWKNVTRFEHSVGVMLLLRKYGADTSEQVAGLLHDVPHTAFSHVADFVFANAYHEFHELYHEEVIAKSEIPAILKKYEIPLTVIHPENFTLLEKKLPDLCADRIDYALRDSFATRADFHRLTRKLSHLIGEEGEFVFTNVEGAEFFARDYIEQDQNSWANPRESALYELLAQAIGHALDKKLLTLSDLFTDDETVMRKLQSSGDAYIHKKLAYFTPAFRIDK